jgi:SAM-dependent methyltransferase
MPLWRPPVKLHGTLQTTIMSWFLYGLALLWILDALRLRIRVATIHLLEPSRDAVASGYYVITAPGVVVDEATRLAAIEWAEAEHLQVVDLIPKNLPCLNVLRLAQIADPGSYRSDPFAHAATGVHALLVSSHVLSRAGLKPGPVESEGQFVQIAKKLKRYASTSTDIAIAPFLKSVSSDAQDLWNLLSDLNGLAFPYIAVLHPLLLIVMLLGLFVSPRAGAAALIAYHLQPLIIIAGSSFRSPDLWQVLLFRIPLELGQWFLIFRSRWKKVSIENPVEVRRPLYDALLRNGSAHFFDSRRPDCPVCGQNNLSVVLRTTDLLQCKPGRFTVERCNDCGHLFQNPRLSVEGLNFYYRDFYDGLGEETTGFIFGVSTDVYLARARLTSGNPHRWLDVGAGHGHFCCAASTIFPDTDFDGLDISEEVDQASRAGWIHRAYRGTLPALSADLSGTYDVVSMFHYLEHTLNQRTEIRAARTVLKPGGLLIIELPNPECAYARWLGRFWVPWFQPQHLHLVSVGNLRRLMAEEGFEPIAFDSANAHIAADFFFATRLFFRWLMPNIDSPWRPRPSMMRQVVYWGAWTLFTPISLCGLLLDLTLRPVFRRAGISNAYRIVARRIEA